MPVLRYTKHNFKTKEEVEEYIKERNKLGRKVEGCICLPILAFIIIIIVIAALTGDGSWLELLPK